MWFPFARNASMQFKGRKKGPHGEVSLSWCLRFEVAGSGEKTIFPHCGKFKKSSNVTRAFPSCQSCGKACDWQSKFVLRSTRVTAAAALPARPMLSARPKTRTAMVGRFSVSALQSRKAAQRFAHNSD